MLCEYLTSVEVTVFLDVTPCSLVCGVSWCLNLQDEGGCTFLNLLVTVYETTCCYIPEEYNVNESSVLHHNTFPH